MEFVFPVYIPSLEKEVLFKELNLKQHKVLLKFILNKKYEQTLKAFNTVIQECCEEDLNIEQLSIVDKFIILLNIRIVCIGNIIESQFDCPTTKKKFVYKIDLNKMLETIENLNIEYNKTIKLDGFTIQCSLPLLDKENLIVNKKDLNEATLQQITKCIRYIKIKNKQINFVGYDYRDCQQIIETLPNKFTQSVIEYINAQEKNINNVDLITVKSPFTQETIHNYQFTLNEETINSYIELFFTDNLHNVYKDVYYMSSKLNFTPEYIERLTPVEKDLYWHYYAKDMEQKQKEQQKANSGNKRNNIGPPLRDATEDFVNEAMS